MELIQISAFKEEFLRHNKFAKVEDVSWLKEIQDNFPEYVYKKIYPKFFKELNYANESLSGNSWY